MLSSTRFGEISPVPEPTQKRYGIRAAYFYVDVTTARLNKITELFENGKLATDVGTVLPLGEARTGLLDSAYISRKGTERAFLAEATQVLSEQQLQSNWSFHVITHGDASFLPNVTLKNVVSYVEACA